MAFASERGTVRARPIKDRKLVPPGNWRPINLNGAHPHSVEVLFAETGLARFVLDFRQIPSDIAHHRSLRSTAETEIQSPFVRYA